MLWLAIHLHLICEASETLLLKGLRIWSDFSVGNGLRAHKSFLCIRVINHSDVKNNCVPGVTCEKQNDCTGLMLRPLNC